MVVKAFCTVIARLIQIVLVLPSGMCLCHTVQECLGSDNIEILTAQLGTLSRNAGYLCLRVGYIVGNVHPGEGAQLQLVLILQFLICLRSIAVNNLRTGITYGSIARLEGNVLPCEQIFLNVLHRRRQLGCYLKHRSLANVSVRFTVLVHVYQVIAPFLGILCVNASPFHCLGIEQHGVSTTRLHDQWLIRTNLIQVRLGDVFLILHPSGSQIEVALRILRNEVLDDLTVFGIVGETSLHQVSLSDGTVSSQVSVTV